MLIFNSKQLLIPLRHLFSHFSSKKMFWILGNKRISTPCRTFMHIKSTCEHFPGTSPESSRGFTTSIVPRAERYICHTAQLNRASFSCLCFKRLFFKLFHLVCSLWNIVYHEEMVRNICCQTWLSEDENWQHIPTLGRSHQPGHNKEDVVTMLSIWKPKV